MASTSNLWIAHGSPMNLPGVARGSPMGAPRITHGSPMDYPRFVLLDRVSSIILPWVAHVMVVIAHGLDAIAHRYPRVTQELPWNSTLGSPMRPWAPVDLA